MSIYMLVHGAWHGAWCWERVAPLLRAQGHEVVTPTLTGLGERADELSESVRLGTHVEDVLEAMERAGEPVILVGHSYAGLAVREAADRAPDRVRQLVLVEGWFGRNGASMLSLAPDWFAAGIRQLARDRGDGWRIPPPDPAMAGVTDPGDAAWLQARLTDQPLRTFIDPTQIEGAVDAIPTTAIVAPPGSLPFREWAAGRGWPIVTLDGGHDLMVTSPDALVRALQVLVAAQVG